MNSSSIDRAALFETSGFFSLGKIDSICKWDDVISFLSALKLLKTKTDSWLSL